MDKSEKITMIMIIFASTSAQPGKASQGGQACTHLVHAYQSAVATAAVVSCYQILLDEQLVEPAAPERAGRIWRQKLLSNRLRLQQSTGRRR